MTTQPRSGTTDRASFDGRTTEFDARTLTASETLIRREDVERLARAPRLDAVNARVLAHRR